MTTGSIRVNVAREICKICYHNTAVGFSVPEDVWRAVVPPRLRDRVLCLACFTRLADEKLVRWEPHIEFYPVSLATHLGLDP